MNQSSHAALVSSLYDTFAQGDLPTLLANFHSSIEWREAEGFRYAEGNPYVGPESVAENIFMRILSEVDGFKVTPGRMTVGDDTVAVEGRYTGVSKVTGATIDAQFVHVWTLKEGKVTHFQQYTDTRQWHSALGD